MVPTDHVRDHDDGQIYIQLLRVPKKAVERLLNDWVFKDTNGVEYVTYIEPDDDIVPVPTHRVPDRVAALIAQVALGAGWEEV